jgi:methionine aminotransferase
VNWENVRNVITPRTRMIVVNTPQNPSSAVWSKEDMNTLISLLKGTDIIVLSDEVYEHIVFDGEKHESCAAYPELTERSLIVYSFGKTLHVTGWKIGYITGPKELMSEFRKVHQYNVFSCNTPLQYAISEYMKDASVYLELSSFYQRKRDRFLGALKNENFNITPAKGSYFQLLQYKDMKGRSDVELAKEWTIRGGITSIPLSVFYPDHKNEGVFRFCFAKSDELLDRAAEKINLL